MTARIKRKKEKRVSHGVMDLSVLFLKEDKMFVAYSPALDLSTCGKTFEEAKKNFSEAMDIFLEECIKDNTLHDVLTSLGWKEIKKEWVPPSFVGQVNIPFPEIPAMAR